MPTLPPIDKNVNHAPHVVLLGAGASIASYIDWGEIGNPLPSMDNLIEKLNLKKSIEQYGFKTDNLNFEAFYDDLSSNNKNPNLLKKIEDKTYKYFSSLSLPNKPTIYDYLILSLRGKDIIATFNWDPFLIQAYIRNQFVSRERMPRITFLHGNVMIGACEKDKICGINGTKCMTCGEKLKPSKLLYPVKHKNYNENIYIKSEWDVLRSYLKKSYFLTIYGYSAPKTDVEARSLMLEVWKQNKTLKLAEVEVIDIAEQTYIEENWKDFLYSHHYITTDNIFKSYLFTHPRRSCDAFAEATLMLKPWHTNRFPKFNSLEELQEWVVPLIDEEIKYEENNTQFSGNYLSPNKGDI